MQQKDGDGNVNGVEDEEQEQEQRQCKSISMRPARTCVNWADSCAAGCACTQQPQPPFTELRGIF